MELCVGLELIGVMGLILLSMHNWPKMQPSWVDWWVSCSFFHHNWSIFTFNLKVNKYLTTTCFQITTILLTSSLSARYLSLATSQGSLHIALAKACAVCLLWVLAANCWWCHPWAAWWWTDGFAWWFQVSFFNGTGKAYGISMGQIISTREHIWVCLKIAENRLCTFEFSLSLYKWQ